MNLLRNYLLIHVDCTELESDFRNELTMASRDRLKGGAESRRVRDELGRILRKSKLSEINKRRKEVLDLDSNQADDLVRSFADNLPLDSEMTKLLDQVFHLHRPDPRAKKDGDQKSKQRRQHDPKDRKQFEPKRFPSFFTLEGSRDGETPAISIPQGSERRVMFSTDVENMYFDRVEEPGDLEVALLDYQENESAGGKAGGKGRTTTDLLNVRKSSPNDGTIKLHLSPTEEAQVGDAVKVKVTLTNPGGDFEQGFWVSMTALSLFGSLGLPAPALV